MTTCPTMNDNHGLQPDTTQTPNPKPSLVEGSGASPCSRCGGLFMVPSDDEDGDVMNTPCPDCNEWSPNFPAGDKANA